MGVKVLVLFLLERYGLDSMFFIIDEGVGFLRLDKNFYIVVVVNVEKGYVDVRISIYGYGGYLFV